MEFYFVSSFCRKIVTYLHCTEFFANLLKFHKIVAEYKHLARDVDID